MVYAAKIGAFQRISITANTVEMYSSIRDVWINCERGTLSRHVCSSDHQFLYVPRWSRETFAKIGKGHALVGGRNEGRSSCWRRKGRLGNLAGWIKERMGDFQVREESRG